MAKLSKSTKTVIIAAGVLLILGVVCLILFMTQPEAQETSSEASSTVNTSIVVTDKTSDKVLTAAVSNETGDYTFTRQKRVVSTTNDDGTVTSSDEYYWTSEQMGTLLPNDTTVSAFMNCLAGLSTKELVEENASDLDKYGLDKPISKVSVTFDDGSDVTMLFGIKNPAATNLVYFRVDGSNDVHEVSYYTVGDAFYSVRDFINLTFSDAYDTNSPKELDYLTIDRKDFDEPVEIRYMSDVAEAAEDENSVVTTFNAYRFTSPITAEVDSTSGQTVVYGVYGLTASSCEYLTYNDEILKQTGLDDPYCTVTFKYNGVRKKLMLGNQIITETQTDDESTPTLTTVTGYYGMIEGEDGIYAFSTSAAPWYTFKVQDIMSRRPISPYIYTVDTLTVDTPDGEYVFTVTGNADEHSFTYNDTTLDDAQFKAFYQHCITSIGEELYMEDGDYTDYIKLTFKYRSEYKDVYGTEQDVIEFFQSDDRKNIIRVNGSVLFKVRQVYTERLLENIDALLNGGEIQLNW